jgi:hypothetical protein
MHDGGKGIGKRSVAMRNKREIARRRPALEPLERRMAPSAAAPGAHHGGEEAPMAFEAQLKLLPTASTSDHARGFISLQPKGNGTMQVTVTLSRISNVAGIVLHDLVPTSPQPSTAVESFPFQTVVVLLAPMSGSGPVWHNTIRGSIDRSKLIGPLAGQPLHSLVKELEAHRIQAVVQTSNGVDGSNAMPGNYADGEIAGTLLPGK